MPQQALNILALSELPAAGTNRVLAWPAAAGSYNDVGFIETGDLGGGGGSGTGVPTGWFQLSDYGTGFANFGDNLVDDQTSALQACFNAASAYMTANNCGATVVLNAGNYRFHGTVTIPTPATQLQDLCVFAYGARMIHKPPPGAGVPMFQYAVPTSLTEGNALNGYRRLRWFGGFYDGDRVDGQIGFDLSATSRAVLADMHIQAFDIGILGRFFLNNTIRDCNFVQNKTHDIWLRSGDWTGASLANSASNMCRIQHTRHYGQNTNQGLIKITDAGGTVIDHAVCEGSGGLFNIGIFANNSSATMNVIRDVWCENTTTQADIVIDVQHKVEVGFMFAKSPTRIDASAGAACVYVTEAGYLGSNITPRFKAASTAQKWRWGSARSNEEFDPSVEGWWVDGVVPETHMWIGAGNGGNKIIRPAWNPANLNYQVVNRGQADHNFDCNTVTLTELAKVVATMIQDLGSWGAFDVTVT